MDNEISLAGSISFAFTTVMILKALGNFVSSMYRSARARECLIINSAAVAATVEVSDGIMLDGLGLDGLDADDFEGICDGCECCCCDCNDD